MPAMISAASASCGTHRGLTKLVASTTGNPVADSRSTSVILSAVAMVADSFCSPSRGPTSTICRRDGMAMSVLQGDEHGVGVDEVPLGGADLGDRAVARGLERQLHLHRLQHHQLLACDDHVARARLDHHHA